MAALTFQLTVISCDGGECEAVFGTPDGFLSAMDARAAAYAAGWRFPNHTTRSGNAARTTSDVCPVCVPGWTAQKQGQRHRQLTLNEARKLREGSA
ncbi:hypothetical protein VA596_41410 [Amycolatopsis sp., V23-08]|uniref:Uncharacterized protein n=1 Tax=Amycolatopsis heterodermiae TaxID=3110235 RepID=A0ABU5RID5_9PSEU|nr:hypothetical protein [Amycolatopsis sp., V23-08]MEA5366045.1 hypothetical protein [Amycolatopsis sp., V23-08]